MMVSSFGSLLVSTLTGGTDIAAAADVATICGRAGDCIGIDGAGRLAAGAKDFGTTLNGRGSGAGFIAAIRSAVVFGKNAFRDSATRCMAAATRGSEPAGTTMAGAGVLIGCGLIAGAVVTVAAVVEPPTRC